MEHGLYGWENHNHTSFKVGRETGTSHWLEGCWENISGALQQLRTVKTATLTHCLSLLMAKARDHLASWAVWGYLLSIMLQKIQCFHLGCRDSPWQVLQLLWHKASLQLQEIHLGIIGYSLEKQCSINHGVNCSKLFFPLLSGQYVPRSSLRKKTRCWKDLFFNARCMCSSQTTDASLHLILLSTFL